MMVKSVTLPLGQLAAFNLFTTRASEWWPPERRHTNDTASTIMMLASGRFYERASDGRELDLGRVNIWDPPKRIVLDFYIATGPDHPTEVEVTFDAQAGPCTLVTVTHRPKPESAHLWNDRAPKYAASWELLLAALERFART